MIEVTDLVKRYGNHTALDHLTFTVGDGKIYGLLGPNGAGKSTTMNIMTGFLCANEGTVVINGYDILKNPVEAKAQIGYLPELPPLYEDMTVREYLEFVCELKKVARDKIEGEIIRVAGKTGVEENLDRLIRNLSKGYKQRVGIAQALISSPQIIILDEPTVGLDPLQIIEIRDLIRELKNEHTVILSSHILSEVSAVCDEILIISKGKLVAQDNAENLSRLSAGSRQLLLCVRGSKEAVSAVLNKMELSADFTAVQDEDVVKLTISLDDGQDIREELFYAFADAKLPILEMHMDHASLEEVFIELTSREEEEIPQAVSGETDDTDDTKEEAKQS